MRIGIKAIAVGIGGGRTFLINIIKELSKHDDIETHVWINNEYEVEECSNIIWHKTNIKSKNTIKRVYLEQSVLKKDMIAEGIDALFSAYNYGIVDFPKTQVILVRDPKPFDQTYLKKYCGRIEGMQQYLKRKLIGRASRESSAIMFPSHSLKNSFVKYYPKMAEKTVVNYYGVPTEKFKRNNNICVGDKIRLLFVSHYHCYKNPGIISDAIDISKEKLMANITMEKNDIKKKDIFNNDYKKIIKNVENGKIKLGRIHYNKIVSIYLDNDICIFPSVVESFGHPLVEAMASGLPIIAADTEINKEICGETALYFDPYNPYELASKISLIINKPRKRQKMVEKGYKKAKQYKWKTYVDNLLSLLRN